MRTIYITAVNEILAKRCAMEHGLNDSEWVYLRTGRELIGVPYDTTIVWKHCSWFLHGNAADLRRMWELRRCKVFEK